MKQSAIAYRVAVGLGAVILLALGPPRVAAESPRLTLAEAAQRALASHPSVGASTALRDQARAAIGEAQAGWLPALRLSGTATRYEKPMSSLPIHSFSFGPLGTMPPFDRTLYQGTLSLGYTLFDAGARIARVRQARSGATVMEAALDATEQALVARAVAGYLEVLGKAQVLEAHDRRLASLRAERVRVGQLFDAGRAAPLEILRVEAIRASAEADRVQLASALETAEQDLARLIDAPVEESRAAHLEAIACRDTTLAPREPLLAAALEASPAVRQARGQRAVAAAGRSLARSALWPELKLVGNYIEYADAHGNETAEWNTGAQLSMPLFAGGAIRQGIARADAAARAAEEQLRLAQMQVGEGLDRARAAVAETRVRVASLKKAVASFEEVARIERLTLQTGSGTQHDYLSAEADLLAARANLVEARYREVEARVELARVAGVLDLNWLARNLEAEP